MVGELFYITLFMISLPATIAGFMLVISLGLIISFHYLNAFTGNRLSTPGFVRSLEEVIKNLIALLAEGVARGWRK